MPYSTAASHNLASATALLITVVFCVITGMLAARKGYNFLLWTLGGGILPLIVLACLPSSDKSESVEEQVRTQKTGNTIAIAFIILNALFFLFRHFR